MFAGISFTTLILVVFLFFWFKKPIKKVSNHVITVMDINLTAIAESMSKDAPVIIKAASEETANAVASSAWQHRQELQAQLQNDYGVSLEDVRNYYLSGKLNAAKPSNNP